MSLERLAAACLFPGFPGLEPPDWLRRRLADGLGGVVLFAWNVADPEQVARLTGEVHAERPEAIVAIDEEGGDVTRLEVASGSSYPGSLALGVVDDVGLSRDVATAMAGDLTAAGIDLDLAPVADVNTNADNPAIGVRSFGSDPALVARHVAAFVEGLQAGGVAACAKHFPGHGDTDVDSHLDLPTTAEAAPGALLPFRAAIEAGVGAIMTAHIRVEAWGPEPATINPEAMGRLRGELGFDGVVLTDALEMRAISGTVGVEAGAVLALAAGADALCLGHDLGDGAVESILGAIAGAVREGRLSEERVAEAASRVARLRLDGVARAPSGVGLEAARRAVRVEGDPRLRRPALVVDLRPEPLQAAGEVDVGLGDFVPGTHALLREAPADAAALVDTKRQLVIALRDPHRHDWERATAEALIRAAADAIVVDSGVAAWRPDRCAALVRTFGAGRVNLQAAAELLEAGRAS